MHHRVFVQDLERLVVAIGRHCKSGGAVYFVGGTSAAWIGWRESTMDADIALAPEPAGLFGAIEGIKRELQINVKLSSPDHFVPAMPGWQGRSPYITTCGLVDFYHYDFYTQALAKLRRNLPRDISDIEAMVGKGLVEQGLFFELFEATVPNMQRYPGVDAGVLRRRAEALFSRIAAQAGQIPSAGEKE